MTETKQSKFNPVSEQGAALQKAYDWLNDELFFGTLPEAMLTLSRNSNLIGGYFTPKRWYNEEGAEIAEIALNSNCLKTTGIVRAMTVICHEMVHLWQYTFGKPSRAGYHNQEFADKCKQIGLRPFTADGKETGQAVDTDLIKEGRAEMVIAEMPEEYTLPWMTEPMENPYPEGEGGGGQGGGQGGQGKGQGGAPGGLPGPSQPGGSDAPKGRAAGTRTKYTCPACGFNLWGKPNGHFECLDCNQLIIEMTGKEGE